MARLVRTALCLLVLLSCSESPTTPTSGCADFSGVYDVTYQGSCPGDTYPKTWELQQEGCAVHTPLVADAPSVNGTAQSSTITLMLRNGFTACLYQLNGTGRLDGGTIRATLAGNVSGPCCGLRSESVQVVATRRR